MSDEPLLPGICRRIDNLLRRIWRGNVAQMARDLKVSHPAMSRVLAGQIPSGKILQKLAEYQDVNAAWLLTGKGRPPPESEPSQEPLTLVDGGIEDGDRQETTKLELRERGCEHNVETIVLNDHGQAWLHVYLDFYDNKLRLMAHNVANVDGNDVPIVDKILIDDVAAARSQQILDKRSGLPVAKYKES